MTPPGAGPDTTAWPSSLALVGAGKMGGAMLEGWLAGGLEPGRVVVIDPGPSAGIADAAREQGIRLSRDAAGQPPASVVVLAIKPQGLAEAAGRLGGLFGPDTLLVSILAGKTVGDLIRAIPGSRAVVRAMPNLPASIRRGASGLFANAATRPAQRELAERLLRGVGTVEWVAEEALIDAVTALSGSGPAYLFHLVECMAEAGAEAGLEPGLADRLARQTVIGAAELLAASGEDPARLRENVTSPGGTTAAALDVLRREPGLAGLMREAVAAAKRRAGELAG